MDQVAFGLLLKLTICGGLDEGEVTFPRGVDTYMGNITKLNGGRHEKMKTPGEKTN